MPLRVACNQRAPGAISVPELPTAMAARPSAIAVAIST
jgi:hypothetical protein